MDVSALGGSAAASQAIDDLANDSVDKEGFLKLLVAQIQNQDPLAPDDSNKYVEQLTEFSSLEQLMNLNQGVNTMNLGQLSNNNQEALRFVGRTVLARGDSFNMEANQQPAPISYRIDGEVSEATVRIYNEDGEVVHERALDARKGPGSYSWDGRNPDGGELPPGKYTLSIEANDVDGNPLVVDTYVRGLVTGVRFDNGYPELMIGDRRVGMGDLSEVY